MERKHTEYENYIIICNLSQLFLRKSINIKVRYHHYVQQNHYQIFFQLVHDNHYFKNQVYITIHHFQKILLIMQNINLYTHNNSFKRSAFGIS